MTRAIENIYYTADNDRYTQQIYYTFGIEHLHDHEDLTLNARQWTHDITIKQQAIVISM